MNKKDALFELIHSLNMNEKRYFSLFASRHTIGDKNNYLRLFEVLNKQKEYNDKPLLHLFHKGSTFPEGRTFAVKNLQFNKQYLYKLILKSLASCYAENTVKRKLRSSLNQMEILMERGLYEQCEKLIAKTKELAKKYEHQATLLELVSIEMEVKHLQSYYEKEEHAIAVMQQKAMQEVEIYRNEIAYSFLSLQMTMNITAQGYIRTASDLSAYQGIIERMEKDKPLSYRAKLHFYFCQVIHYAVKEEYEKGYEIAVKAVKFMEEHSHHIAEAPSVYALALSNLSSIQLSLGKYKEMRQSIQKLKEVSLLTDKKHIRLKMQIFYSASIMELSLYCVTGEFEKAVAAISSLEEEMNSYQVNTLYQQKKMLLNYGIAHSFLGNGNYSAANKYINEIINDTDSSKTNFGCFARIMSLIIHFELNNQDLLEYTVKSTHRFLYKKERLYKVETIILDFISKELPKIYSNKELLVAFKKLKEDIELVTTDSFERKALEYFDFISWLESKIENRPFAEVVREKAGCPSPTLP